MPDDVRAADAVRAIVRDAVHELVPDAVSDAVSELVTREELRALLSLWRAGGVDAEGVCGWVAGRWPEGDARFSDEETGGLSVAREVVAELDLLPVHLLTVEDVPAVLRALDAARGQGGRAVDELRTYLDGIDRKSRSKKLRKDPLYRPFCL